MRYEISQADREPFPDAYGKEPRYLGFRSSDEAKPYAKYFRPVARPIQEHVVHALVAGKYPSEFGYGVNEVADRLTRPGYENMETGWTRLGNGVVQINVHTHMPNITAAMWDWWFGWHGRETQRYKLWHPEAHQFSALGQDRSADPTLTDRQRYVGNVSYVDEYIGGRRQTLAIRFLDPERLGFSSAAGTTHICARVGLSSLPLAVGWLVHQVRPTDGGAEMRSRFFLNDPAVLDLPARALPSGISAKALNSGLGRTLARRVAPIAAGKLIGDNLATDMISHCATEMNHLAEFLPQLHIEFKDSI
ncbi:hypothetical protein QN239_02590 [Mycolicibacterium sp. Y3]